MINYYKILNVSPNASLNEIKAAYHSLAKKYHPDVFKGDENIFKQINEAYIVLSNPLDRNKHDRDLKNNDFYNQQNEHIYQSNDYSWTNKASDDNSTQEFVNKFNVGRHKKALENILKTFVINLIFSFIKYFLFTWLIIMLIPITIRIIRPLILLFVKILKIII